MRLPSYQDMLQVGGVLILGILFVGWAVHAYADSIQVRQNEPNWYAIYQSSNANAAGTTAGACSDMLFSHGTVEITRAAEADVVLTLQKSIDGTAWANVSANHTYSAGDTNSAHFDFLNKGGKCWRLNVPAPLGANTTSIKGYLWRP